MPALAIIPACCCQASLASLSTIMGERGCAARAAGSAWECGQDWAPSSASCSFRPVSRTKASSRVDASIRTSVRLDARLMQGDDHGGGEFAGTGDDNVAAVVLDRGDVRQARSRLWSNGMTAGTGRS